MRAARPTLESVAQRARVSRQTVSNVINSPELVRPKTRERVEQAITALRYRPHQGARSLRTQRSRLLGVRMEPFVDGVNGSVLDRFIHALAESADRIGYRTLIYTATDDAAEINAYQDLLAAYELDAFVLTSTHQGDLRTGWLQQRAVPFVTFGRPWGSESAHSWVDVDGASGTAEVTRRLIRRGHRRIAFVGWPVGSEVGDDRRRGWSDTLTSAGLSPSGLSAHVEDDDHSGRQAVDRLLGTHPAPTAFVCASDSLALGALRALGERGLTAGPDLAVIGFDDTAAAAAVGLSTVAQPLVTAAQLCMQILVDALEGPPDQPVQRRPLAPTVIVRTTGGDEVSPTPVPSRVDDEGVRS